MKNTNKIVYGSQAYTGFARAIGSQLGLNVQIQAGSKACIDQNGTVYLPDMQKFQTEREFTATCGIIVHELAHQFYASNGEMVHCKDRLHSDSLNAVLDVADETWVSRWFEASGNNRPGELLDFSNAHSFSRNASGGENSVLGDWNNADTHVWKILCVGIYAARGKLGRNWRKWTIRKAKDNGVDAAKVFSLIRQAKIGKKDSGKGGSPTYRRFIKLHKLARAIADLLAPLATSTTQTMPSELEVAIGKGSDDAGNATVATESEGGDIATGQASLKSIPPKVAKSNGAGSGNADTGNNGISFNQSTYDLLSPCIARIAERISTDGESIDRDNGLYSGSNIGQAYRLATDGQCMSRWQTNEHADGVSVSVVLDCSGSMSHVMPEVAGIARAFATQLRNCGEVQSLTFGDFVTDSKDFATVENMGGTRTDLALAKAIKFHENRQGQKWIVLITDGAPYSRELSDAQCHAAHAKGIRILVVGLHCSLQFPPMVKTVSAIDVMHLAIELDSAARQIEYV